MVETELTTAVSAKCILLVFETFILFDIPDNLIINGNVKILIISNNININGVLSVKLYCIAIL